MFYSQFGEDKILADIFRDKLQGTCVEVGANDGLHGSTTLHFEQAGWKTVLVEPNPLLCEKLRAERVGQVFECAASDVNGTAVLDLAEGADLAHALSSISRDANTRRTVRRHRYTTREVEVATRRLDDVLAEAGVGEIDFMSIDVEGHELSVLKGFSLETWTPQIVLIEDNVLFGARPVRRNLIERGYVRFLRTGVNDWYTPASNASLANRRHTFGYFKSLIAGRAMFMRHALAQHVKRVPGTEAIYRGVKRLWS